MSEQVADTNSDTRTKKHVIHVEVRTTNGHVVLIRLTLYSQPKEICTYV